MQVDSALGHPKRKRVLRFLRLMVSVTLLAWVYRANGIQLESLTLSRVSSPLWVAPGLLIVLVVIPFLGASRWRIFLSFVGVVERRLELVRVFFLSTFFGVLLPSILGPDAVRMYLIEKRHPKSRGKTSATVLSERVIGFILLTFIGFLGAIFVRNVAGAQGLVWIMGGTLLALLSILFLTKSKTAAAFILAPLGRLPVPTPASRYLLSFSRALRSLPLRRILPRAVPIMVLFQLSTITLVWVLFRAFEVQISFGLHLAFFPIITIISLLPGSIGGFGLREGAFVHFYGLVGIPPETAFAVSLLFFLITSGVSATVGGVLSLTMGIRKAELMRTSVELRDPGS